MALNKAENADLNIIVIEPKSIDFSDFFDESAIKKSILVVNKSDLGVNQISNEIRKYNPIFISVKKEKNLDQMIDLIKENLKNKFI